MLFFFLYFSIINERVHSETENLLSRGVSHRDVLEKNFDLLTIKHVVLMESEAETKVVITDQKFEVIKSSNPLNEDIKKLIVKGKKLEISPNGTVIESKWKTEPYLATASPIQIEGNIKGYVFMFLNSNTIRGMIQSLTQQFLIVGFISVLLLVITTFFLTKFITKPLIQMKKATEKLGKGKTDVALDIYREDELGDLARSIQKLSDDLERLKKERSDFFSSISHELRTPLTYLKGYTSILRRPNLSNKEKDEYLTIIEEETSNLTRLIKGLFDLAKMDQNQFSINKERISICDFLKDMISKFKPVFEEKRITLNLSCDRNIYVMVDPIRFSQVISNFLDNALKYSPSNTSVHIAVTKTEKNVIIKIKDQGIGIPKEDIPFIWNRFYRVDKSRSRSTGGSGIGLTIAKEIIERHGGKVGVESVLGEGTTFTIYLQSEVNFNG